MTATRPKTTMPDFEGREVSRASVKITGAGTGLSDGLSMQPIALDVGDDFYFVGRYRCAGVSHDEDKDELIVRVHKLHTEDMAPIDKATADRVLAEYADETQRRKDEIEGQLRLDAEHEAEERERQDRAATGNARRTGDLKSVPTNPFETDE